MTPNLCQRCGQWFDPVRPHICGVLGDETARRLEERLDSFARRLRELEVDTQARLNRLEAAQAQIEFDCRSPSTDTTGKTLANAPSPVRIVLPLAPPSAEPQIAPEPKAAPDKRAAHARYMKQWRLRLAMRRGNVHA
jgi:hypothetical protein